MNATEVVVAFGDVDLRLDSIWVLTMSFIIFFMQLGFLLLEAGAVPEHHTKIIMAKNISDTCFGALGWYFVGNYIYSGQYITNEDDQLVSWFQGYVFAVTTSTILSGGVACRISYKAYVIYSTILSCWVFPIGAKWAWGDGGWLKEFGYQDFAGSGAVHAVGGAAALVGSIAIGPRKHRFAKDGRDLDPEGSSDVCSIIGFFIIWFCWYAFNAGSSGGVTGASVDDASRAALNTLLASTSAGCVGLIMGQYNPRKMLTILINSVLGGLVGVTASCSVLDTYVAILFGIGGAFLCNAASRIVAKCQIDDPVDAISVHGICGLYGVIMLGIFHPTDGLMTGKTKLFFANTVGAIVLFLWSALNACIFFFFIGRFMAVRVSEDEEVVGLDYVYMNGAQKEKLDEDKIAVHNDMRRAKKRMQKVSNSSATNSTSVPTSTSTN